MSVTSGVYFPVIEKFNVYILINVIVFIFVFCLIIFGKFFVNLIIPQGSKLTSAPAGD